MLLKRFLKIVALIFSLTLFFSTIGQELITSTPVQAASQNSRLIQVKSGRANHQSSHHKTHKSKHGKRAKQSKKSQQKKKVKQNKKQANTKKVNRSKRTNKKTVKNKVSKKSPTSKKTKGSDQIDKTGDANKPQNPQSTMKSNQGLPATSSSNNPTVSSSSATVSSQSSSSEINASSPTAPAVSTSPNPGISTSPTTPAPTQQVTVMVYGPISKGNQLLLNGSVTIKQGDTVYDAIKRACSQQNIPFNALDDGSSAYVTGIGGFNAGNFGATSGWLYSVNGSFSNLSCGSYPIKDGDIINWMFTQNQGKDRNAPIA